MHIFRATRIGGLHVSSTLWLRRGVINFLIIKWGGHKNIAEVLSEIYLSPHSEENGGPLMLRAGLPEFLLTLNAAAQLHNT